MSIDVHNHTDQDIAVAISFWGGDSSGNYFTIEKGGQDTWDRSDPAGFVMSVIFKAGEDKKGAVPYYVLPDSLIEIHGRDKVRYHENGPSIPPCVPTSK